MSEGRWSDNAVLWWCVINDKSPKNLVVVLKIAYDIKNNRILNLGNVYETRVNTYDKIFNTPNQNSHRCRQ